MVLNLLRKIDIYGCNYEFSINGNRSYKTKIGGLISFLAFIAMVILFVMLGKNFYQRENPITSMSKEYSKEYFNYTLKPDKFLFGFQIVDQNSNLFDRKDLFYIEPHYIKYQKSVDGINIKVEDRILSYHHCTEEDTNFSNQYLSVQLYNYYCLDEINLKKGLNLGGLWDSQEFSYIKIKVRHCLSGEYFNAKNNITCNTNTTELENVMKDYKYFQIFLQNYFLNSNDYDDPFKLSLNVLYETMDLKIQKKIYYYFKNGIIEDKKDWFTETFEEKSLIGIDRTRSDFMESVSDYFTTTFYETNLYFDKIIETYNRRYMKIQEVIANIGGIMKFIVFFTSIFIQFYNYHSMYNEIIKEINYKNFVKDTKDKDFSKKLVYTNNKDVCPNSRGMAFNNTLKNIVLQTGLCNKIDNKQNVGLPNLSKNNLFINNNHTSNDNKNFNFESSVDKNLVNNDFSILINNENENFNNNNNFINFKYDNISSIHGEKSMSISNNDCDKNFFQFDKREHHIGMSNNNYNKEVRGNEKILFDISNKFYFRKSLSRYKKENQNDGSQIKNINNRSKSLSVLLGRNNTFNLIKELSILENNDKINKLYFGPKNSDLNNQYNKNYPNIPNKIHNNSKYKDIDTSNIKLNNFLNEDHHQKPKRSNSFQNNIHIDEVRKKNNMITFFTYISEICSKKKKTSYKNFIKMKDLIDMNLEIINLFKIIYRLQSTEEKN